MIFFLSLVWIFGMLDIQQAFQMNPTSYRYRKLTGSGTVKLVLVKGEAKVSDNAESENDRRKRLRLKARKMMFNEKGVPYAPWMVRQIDEEDMIDLLIKKETGESRFKKSSRSNDGTEMEASGGLKWRKAANQVELSWITSLESGNQGFIVEKRPIVSSDFAVVDSYTKNSQLISRGASGGRYRYLDPISTAGSWIYRVLDCNEQGKKTVLCQCLVELETSSESQQQGLVAVALIALLAGIASIAYGLDPPR